MICQSWVQKRKKAPPEKKWTYVAHPELVFLRRQAKNVLSICSYLFANSAWFFLRSKLFLYLQSYCLLHTSAKLLCLWRHFLVESLLDTNHRQLITLPFAFIFPEYSCALQKDILVHGRLYVSKNYLCFYSNIFRWETCVSITNHYHQILIVSVKFW